MENKLLHIICLTKIVEDMDDISPGEYLRAEDGCMDMSYARKVINCFDEAALENALRIKDRRSEANLDTRITVLSCNPGYASHFLTTFFAIKVDDVITVETDLPLWHVPSETARILCSEIERIKDDDARTVIFAGKQAPPLNSGLVPAYMAERLDLMMIGDAFDIYPDEEGLTVERSTENSFEIYQLKEDALVVFGNTRFSYLRVPTLREKMKCKGCKPEIRSYRTEIPEAEPSLHCPIREMKCEMFSFEEETEAAEWILDQLES